MPAALPLQNKISQASQGETKFRVIRAQYGNGYSQRAPDGINNVVDSWNIAWENISGTDFSTVVTALKAAAGVDFFTWTPPGDATSKKFVVTSFSREALSGDVYSVSAKLEQEFDL